MYQAVCDRCGKPCIELGMAWATRLSAQIAALESEWLIVNHRLYCPDCVEYDEETDSYKTKTKEIE